MNRHLEEFLRKATAIVAMAAVLGAPQLAWATPITLAGWDFNGYTNYGASPAAPNTTAANLAVVGLTRGANVGTGGSAASNAWGGTTWNGKSLTFSFTADAGYEMSFDSFANYNVRRSGSGATSGQWQYQVGAGEFTNIGSLITWGSTTTATGNAQSSISLSGITALQNVTAGSTVTFRLNLAGETTGTWYLQNFQNGNDFSALGTVIATGGGGEAGTNYYWVGDDTTLGGAGTWAQADGTAWRTTDTAGTGEAWNSTKIATFGGATAGTVTVSDTVNANAGLSFATSGYTLTGGTVSLGGADAAANSITTAAATAIDSLIAGTTGLTKAGAGGLTLSAANTLSGGITVSAGSLIVAGASALGNNAVTINGGTLSSDANPRTISNAVTFTGNGGLAADGSAPLELDGTVSFGSGSRTVTVGSGATASLTGTYGTGGVIKAGSGTLVLGNNATLTGLGVSAGTLQITNGFEVTTSSQPTISGGTLEVNGTLRIETTAGSVTPTGSLNVGSSGVVIQQGNGSVTNLLFGGSTYSWAPGSTFVFRDFTSTPTVSNRTYAMNVRFESSGSPVAVGVISGSNPWTVQGDLTIGENVSFNYGTYTGTLTYSGDVIVGGTLGVTNGARSFTIGSGKELRLENAGTLNIASGQTVTLSGGVRTAATAAQTGTISGGTLSLSDGNRTFDVAAGTGNAGLAVSSAISNGSLTKSGIGRLTLSGANTYSGGTTVSAGTLSVAADAALGGSAGGISLGGGTLEMTSGFTLGSGRTITAATGTTSTIAVTTGTVSYAGAFTGSGNLDKIGAGRLTVSNASSDYSGTFTISAGTLEVTGANAFANATLSQTGGMLLLAPAGGGDVTIPDLDGSGGTTEIGTGVTAVVGGPGNSSYNGQIRGQGALRKEGDGVLTLNGNNDFAGTTRISQGRLKLGNGGALSATPLIEIASGAIFDLTSKTGGFALGTGQRLGGLGTILGNLEFGVGSQIAFDSSGPMLVGSGTVSFAAGFGIDSIVGLDSSVAEGTYTLLDDIADGTISPTNLANFGAGNAFDLGGGKSAYFREGSLQVVVVPEPNACLVGGLGLALVGLMASRRRVRAAAL